MLRGITRSRVERKFNNGTTKSEYVIEDRRRCKICR